MRLRSKLVPVRPGGITLGKTWFGFSRYSWRTWGRFRPPSGSLWKGGVNLGPIIGRW